MKIACLLLLILGGCATSELQSIVDRNLVEETVNRMYIATDDKDWKTVTALFDDKVYFDMSSLSGKAASTETGKSIADMWATGLKDVPFIHHQSGNFLIVLKGNEATVFNYATAAHYFPNGKDFKTRLFVGSYDWHLVKKGTGWKIDSLRFKKKFVSETR